MDRSKESVPWDYFLSAYERDLLKLTLEELMQKYPKMEIAQVKSDKVELTKNLEEIKKAVGKTNCL